MQSQRPGLGQGRLWEAWLCDPRDEGRMCISAAWPPVLPGASSSSTEPGWPEATWPWGPGRAGHRILHICKQLPIVISASWAPRCFLFYQGGPKCIHSHKKWICLCLSILSIQRLSAGSRLIGNTADPRATQGLGRQRPVQCKGHMELLTLLRLNC